MTEVKHFLLVFTRFSHCSWYFGPFLHADLLQSSDVLGLSLINFQLPPKIFDGVEVWRLARPLQDLEILFTEPLLRYLRGVFGIIVMLEDPAMSRLQCAP